MAFEPRMLQPPIELPADAALPRGLVVRRPRVADQPAVVAAIPDWWGMPATSLHLLLPPLFFQHFSDTSFLAEDADGLAAFLIGFHSHAQPDVAYIHFVGVRPDLRHLGLARTLYETFFAEARAAGCHRVDAITGVPNRRSQAFHAALGFEASGDTDYDGVRAWRDYDGPGEHRVAFSRAL
ncbi:GNAT family N-acetyltransferase [Agromyces albus]|uniref:GNAT family N-acetyltransferase n=1 Tax=Agromyces albus TaxID=205332 RepID=UPI00277FCEEB|nr:GNAT family N-acetyltransferase [Agromyces albus]MDQ0577512.1 putative GNAT superfamily acetyltransferase [Agromyces albus]